ncbi:DUF551 domain-containing protein [Erwinia tracheiphila]|uniref:DUF551 domain-containing protein n=2 Tax=Erwinia tracheiphila TaxID=65700 RepID=A0A345CT89_9GAMM|nr:DUF551 domain-containing protein [Erwinia tracheiphila]AXF76656.1 DUF551 domain-containing protein [Erwinia tracheiphila]UIA84671.1 DUF551 domain-containing protein [Erwinia tracheiphila]UIA93263.1 DUF551 domain-containing protein [Erwinia tracheiphila]
MNIEERQALIDRCKTIAAWREKYGDYANVMMPALEAKKIAEIALSSLQADGSLTDEDTTPQSPAQQWIRCSERLPVEGQSVVIANIGHGCICEAAAVTYYPPHFALIEGLEASNYDGGASISLAFEATHWMPLLAAPEPGGDES